jgi:hypothetical protein
MPNERVRQIHQFISISGAGKKQSAYGVAQPNGDIDTRENCRVEITDNVNREILRDCDNVDIISEPINNRDTQIVLTYENGFTPHQHARFLAYKEGVAAAPTGSTVNEVQTITKTGTVTGGTFTISLTHEGRTGLTEAIAFDASNATILAALLKKTGGANAMGKLIKAGDVTLGGGITTALTITFTGRFAATNMAMVVIDDALITGGGTLEETQTTAGDQRLHAITRSTNGTLPLFSIITGDKNSAYDDFKYVDCAVDSIVLESAVAIGGTAVVRMTVTIFCNYTASREAAYTAPTCVNITPLRVQDCKLKINSTFETSDVSTLSTNLSNQIPRDAAFGYDDIDPTVAYQRGDNPTQEFTASVYGSPDTALYQLAEAEETAGNEVEFIAYYGHTGNRVTITGATTKIKFQQQRLGFAGALNQSVINITATPHSTPPLTFSASVPQSTAFLVASA